MKFIKSHFSLLLAVAFLATAFASPAMATTLQVTVEKMNSTFTSVIGSSGAYTMDPDGDAVTPFLLDFLGGGDPFAGNIDYTISGNATDGSPSPATLGSDVQATNLSGSTLYMRVILEGDGYTLPGSNGSSVSAKTTYVSTASTGDAKLKSYIGNSSPPGNLIGTGIDLTASTPPGSPPTSTASFVRGSTFDMMHVYDITLNPGMFGEVNMTTDVTPVPEPCTILSALLGLAPMVYTVRTLRRRKSRG